MFQHKTNEVAVDQPGGWLVCPCRAVVPGDESGIRPVVEADILKQVTVGRRNRAFEAPEVIETFTALERQLASPERRHARLVADAARPRRRRVAAGGYQ